MSQKEPNKTNKQTPTNYTCSTVVEHVFKYCDSEPHVEWKMQMQNYYLVLQLRAYKE